MSVGLWLLFGSAVAACGVSAWAGHRAGQRRVVHPLPEVWDLDARPVLNADERQAMRHLREALPYNTVLAKLPLVRLCRPRDAERQHYWFALLGNLHVSFAICSTNARVLAVIDLEPARGMSARALRIKQAVLAACRIRYVHCRAGNLPLPSDLELLLRPQGLTSARLAPIAAAPARPAADPHLLRARSQLTDTVRNRRAARPLAPDSMFAQDSFFAAASQLDTAANSDFSPSISDSTDHAPLARR